MFGYENLKNLLVAEVGTIYNNEIRKRHYVIGRYKKELYSTDNHVYDIFNRTKYFICSYSNYNRCVRYFPLIDVIDDYNQIKSGYISRKVLFELVHELNEGNDYKTIKSEINVEKDKKKKKNSNNKYNDLTSKNFKIEPAIGRKKEINNLITILASDKKSPILVGESGTGKTSIIEEFAYLIQKGEVPKFLEGKKIIEVSSSNLVSGSKYVGVLEEKFEDLLRYIKKNDAILFIDEIHTLFGAGASANNDNDLAELLKGAINRDNIKVIGTTTIEEYNKYFITDALKRRFELIKVEEPSIEQLRIISRKVFEDYSNLNNISLCNVECNIDNIIDLFIDLTKKEHRNYSDKTYNPDLIVTLIDKSFASVKVSNRDFLNIEDLIYAVESTDRIYEPPKEKCVANLRRLKPKENKKLNTVVPFGR